MGAALERAAETEKVGRAVERAARRRGAALELNPMGNAECRTEVGRPMSSGDSEILLVNLLRMDFDANVDRVGGLLLGSLELSVGFIAEGS